MKYSMHILITIITAVIITANGVATTDEDVEIAWKKFKVDHGKQYKSLLEEMSRKAIFMDNLDKIAQHNKLYEQGETTFTLRINKFADMTPDEIKSLHGYQGNKIGAMSDMEISTFVPVDVADVPKKFDWREKDANAITPVKDQGNCGSCWAFSVTGALEAQYYLKTGKLISMSEQNLVDCSNEYGNAGCAGGDMILAYNYIYAADAIDSEDGYPYEGVNNTCRFSQSENVTTIKGYTIIENGNEEHLKAAIATQGPLAVAVDARSFLFQFYDGGIFYSSHCFNGTDFDINELDHAMLVVGYGSEDRDFWLLKNSWGPTWGIDGYMKMARSGDNICGIASEATYPTLY